jgi:hypothetical protein
MNEGRKVCFVYFVCHIEISQTTTPLVIMLMVWLQSPQRVSKGAWSWFHYVSSYGGEVLLNIEHFFIH